MDIVIGRRERKKLATRQALRSAALALAVERGLDAVTVEDISDAADVSPRTFFNYFGSKEEAITAPDPERVAAVRAAVAERPAGESSLRAVGAVLTQLIADNPDRAGEFSLRMRLIRANPALLARHMAGFDGFERALAEAVAERTGTDPDSDPYPALVAGVALGALRAVIGRWQQAPAGSPAPSQLVADAFAQLSAGLPAPARRRPRRRAGAPARQAGSPRPPRPLEVL